MNRPSPDDMKEIIMAEQRVKIEKLEKKNKELKEENKELKNEIWECHWLMDEIDFWKREAKMLWWKQKHMKKEDIIILVFIAIMLLFTAYLTKLRFNL